MATDCKHHFKLCQKLVISYSAVQGSSSATQGIAEQQSSVVYAECTVFCIEGLPSQHALCCAVLCPEKTACARSHRLLPSQAVPCAS